MNQYEVDANSSSITAVIGVFAMRIDVTCCSTPSSVTRKLSAFSPGTNWRVLSSSTFTSRFTIGTSTRIEKVSLFGFFTFSSAGAGGGASSVFFFGSTIPLLPVSGPLSSVVGGGAGFCCCGVAGCCCCAGALCAVIGAAPPATRLTTRPTAPTQTRLMPAAPKPIGDSRSFTPVLRHTCPLRRASSRHVSRPVSPPCPLVSRLSYLESVLESVTKRTKGRRGVPAAHSRASRASYQGKRSVGDRPDQRSTPIITHPASRAKAAKCFALLGQPPRENPPHISLV